MAEQRVRRVLLVTRNLPPLLGGMERLNWHMAHELSRRMEVRVIGPKGCRDLLQAGMSADEVPLRPLWKFLLTSFIRTMQAARRWRPDVIFAGSGLTAPMSLMAARVLGARSVVYVHGLDLVVSHAVYRYFWLPALRRADRIVANSHATAKLAADLGIPAARIGVVHPGVSLPPDRSSAGERIQAFRAKHGLVDKPLMLSVGRLTPRKGLRDFILRAMPYIVSQVPDALLVIVGGAPADALNAKGESVQSLLDASAHAGVRQNIQWLGALSDEDLSTAYWASQVHVFPVKHIPGDPEGFGMVAVEAAAHDTPTIAFATGGVVDAVGPGKSGWLVSPGDYAGLAHFICDVLSSQPKFSCRQFASAFTWDEFGGRIARELAVACQAGKDEL